METLDEVNRLTVKSDKKTPLTSSRSKSRQLRRSHAAVDNDGYTSLGINHSSTHGVSTLAASFVSFHYNEF